MASQSNRPKIHAARSVILQHFICRDTPALIVCRFQMIIHKLILHHLGHKDDGVFYEMQAKDAIDWLKKQRVQINGSTRALDLGCGHGVFGAELLKIGCQVDFSDESNQLLPNIEAPRFKTLNLDREPLATLGAYDLVICSNVFEHLARPGKFIDEIGHVLAPGGHMYLSWTNWLSPWGGHEFSPFHYLGARRGHRWFDRVTGRQRKHTPHENLFPTHIGRTLSMLAERKNLRVLQAVPRYYPELAFITKIPVLREFLTWNIAVLIQRAE